ncbi:MAG: aminopeptidase N [Pseudobdellovibrionaceae bacterium]
MQKSQTPQKIYLKDYQAPNFSIENLELFFNLNEDVTHVQSRMALRKTGSESDLWLDGENLKLISVKVNGSTPRFEIREGGLQIFDLPDQFTLEIETEIKPQENTALEGLYKSNGAFCTQCEAQGFRRITYFLDRPDVMTTYRVRIEADEKKYPVLLSNGNRLSLRSLPGGRHETLWEDPFKKPCYLFALVAGDLGVIRDTYTTRSGKLVNLEIYAAHGKQDRCHFAMESLKKSMKWDEERFGREYDLSTFMILAVDDFNAGAMENKGLNIFNSRLVFADSKTATDLDYFRIESVVAHEYFHNWTGNRVTLRDWFHLSLKEGLTVFRDQEFSMDQSSRALIRIENVDELRNSQFSEDAGPNAHPIRPASCFAVDNFFTSTIYEKGAEIIRMMQTMVGRPGFRKGMDTYFERHDGQAVIIEDFARAIAEPNAQNWEQFKLWYSQAGTPQVRVREDYDSSSQRYTLELSQTCPPTSQEKIEGLAKKPFHIPLMIGLLDPKTGKDFLLKSPQVVVNSEKQNLIHLKQERETFIFEGVSTKPVLSLNRQFSAPIHLDWDASFEELLFLMQNDSDAFNRWESAQKIYLRLYHELIGSLRSGATGEVSPAVVSAFQSVLENADLDPDLKEKLMGLPGFDYLAQLEPVLDGPAFLKAHDQIALAFAQKSEKTLLEIYERFHGQNAKSLDPKDFGRRRLKNKALGYLSYLPAYQQKAMDQFRSAEIMTDQQAALLMLVEMQSSLRDEAISQFYDKWKNESIVLNKWFAIQAQSSHSQTFATVQKLLSHPQFELKNPNRVYSLLATFGSNLAQFHRPDLDTYSFMADQILQVDRLNPQVAARLAGCFDVWTKLPETSKKKAHQELSRLLRSGLSSNTHEIIQKAFEAE